MPKVILIKPKPIPADYIGDMFRRYKDAYEMSTADMGDSLGCSEGTVRNKKSRGFEKFTLKDFKNYCRCLHVPPEEAAKAIQLFLEQ